MEELEKAHTDYEKRRNEIITKLTTLKSYLSEDSITDMPIQWIDQIIEFIKEKEI